MARVLEWVAISFSRGSRFVRALCYDLSALATRAPWPIDSHEWESYFDESGQLLKSRDYILVQIMERGLDPSVRLEVWKFLTGFYSWRSTYDERLVANSRRRKSYESLCNMCEKIQPLLESELQEFLEVRNSIKYQQGFHEMILLFRLLVEKDHEIYWLFQFFHQKTENSCIMNIGVEKNLTMLRYLIALMDPVLAKLLGKPPGFVMSLFPWFSLCFQRVLRSFDDVWRLWEVLLTRLPCRNFQVMIAHALLQQVRDQIVKEDMSEGDILMAKTDGVCLVWSRDIRRTISFPSII
uniref:TBC1 domain family member 21 n=1 Tax=Varanus komodoensis TaxID=61221 RepID=A0A8D2J1E0_VARKO